MVTMASKVESKSSIAKHISGYAGVVSTSCIKK